jgi:beta-glucosidase
VSPVEPSLPRPVRELKQFTKVKLDKGESKTVTLHLDRSAFEHFDVFSHGWVADKGEYRIQLGDNSQNILLETSVVL